MVHQGKYAKTYDLESPIGSIDSLDRHIGPRLELPFFGRSLRCRPVDKSPNFLAYQQERINGSLAVFLLKQFGARLGNMVYDGQHNSSTMSNEQRFVPFFSTFGVDGLYSFPGGFNGPVYLSLLLSGGLQCLGRCPVEVKVYVLRNNDRK